LLSGYSPSAVGVLHQKLVFGRRVNVLSSWFAEVTPLHSRVLDVGCGDGLISSVLQRKRPDLDIAGIDVLARDVSHIAVELFDGTHIPYSDGAFDFVLFSDVLHHTADPAVLLREASRVASRGLIVKDHYRKGLGAGARLRLMDWVGNARFGVSLPYNYWTEQQWKTSWNQVGLRPEQLITRLGLYPLPADWLFGAQLHFIARLEKCVPSLQSLQ
jgi:SAM-dependent methyltransferase